MPLDPRDAVMFFRMHRGAILAALLALLSLVCAAEGASNVGGKKADFSLTAEEFTREFLKDEKAADRKYQGKVVEVTGKVYSLVGKEGGKVAVLLLAGANRNEKEAIPTLIHARLQPGPKHPVFELAKGQQVRLTGEIGQGSGSTVIWLKNGVVRGLGKSNVVVITAADLAGEFSREAEAASRKFADKEILVTGEVAELVTKDGYYAKLKGDGKTRVSVPLNEDELRLLKKGQTVRLRGMTLLAAYSNGEVSVSMGFIVEVK